MTIDEDLSNEISQTVQILGPLISKNLGILVNEIEISEARIDKKLLNMKHLIHENGMQQSTMHLQFIELSSRIEKLLEYNKRITEKYESLLANYSGSTREMQALQENYMGTPSVEEGRTRKQPSQENFMGTPSMEERRTRKMQALQEHFRGNSLMEEGRTRRQPPQEHFMDTSLIEERRIRKQPPQEHFMDTSLIEEGRTRRQQEHFMSTSSVEERQIRKQPPQEHLMSTPSVEERQTRKQPPQEHLMSNSSSADDPGTRVKRRREFISLSEESSKAFRMSRNNTTIPSLLDEWYNSKGNMPSVEERNKRYWWTWRQGPEEAYYKKRHTIIKFIDNLSENINVGNISREEAGALVEEYRLKKGLGIQSLSLSLRPKFMKSICAELEDMWNARSMKSDDN